MKISFKILILTLCFFHKTNCIVVSQSIFSYNHRSKPFSLETEETILQFQTEFRIKQATESFDPNGKIVPLFSRFGEINFLNFQKIAINTPNKTFFNNLQYPQTTTLINKLKTEVPENLQSEVYCGGKFQEICFDLVAQLKIPNTPFSAEIELPFSRMICDQIQFVDKNNKTNIFLNSLNRDFDKVLAENSYQPLSSINAHHGLPNIILSLNFQEKSKKDAFLIDHLWSSLSTGLILPLTTYTETSKNYFFSVPRGGNFGTRIKYELGISFNKSFEAIFFGENNFYFKEKAETCPTLNKNLLFFNFLPPQETSIKPGAQWYLGCEIRSKLFLDSLFFSVGYSYKSQENIVLELEKKTTCGDSQYYFDNNKKNEILSLYQAGNIDLSRNDRINRLSYKVNNFLLNKDPRLQRSYLHLLSFSINYKPQITPSHWFDQTNLSFSCNLPIFGKSSFAGIEFASNCTLGLSFNL